MPRVGHAVTAQSTSTMHQSHGALHCAILASPAQLAACLRPKLSSCDHPGAALDIPSSSAPAAPSQPSTSAPPQPASASTLFGASPSSSLFGAAASQPSSAPSNFGGSKPASSFAGSQPSKPSFQLGSSGASSMFGAAPGASNPVSFFGAASSQPSSAPSLFGGFGGLGGPKFNFGTPASSAAAGSSAAATNGGFNSSGASSAAAAAASLAPAAEEGDEDEGPKDVAGEVRFFLHLAPAPFRHQVAVVPAVATACKAHGYHIRLTEETKVQAVQYFQSQLGVAAVERQLHYQHHVLSPGCFLGLGVHVLGCSRRSCSLCESTAAQVVIDGSSELLFKAVSSLSFQQEVCVPPTQSPTLASTSCRMVAACGRL